MTKLEICAIEDANPGQVFLYPEGSFYKAYQKSAWLLCTRVHPFKVSARPLNGLDGPLLSVGFPMSSLDKFSAGLSVTENPRNGTHELTLKLSVPSNLERDKVLSQLRLQKHVIKVTRA